MIPLMGVVAAVLSGKPRASGDDPRVWSDGVMETR